MRWLLLVVTLGSALGSSGCISHSGHSGKVVHYPAFPEAAKQAERKRRREMTWGEYYTEITERARRRGTMVVWISPPSLRVPRAELTQ
jgi:hypothetical protein